jgi:formylmethanofuran dehydrogenase subunit D
METKMRELINFFSRRMLFSKIQLRPEELYTARVRRGTKISVIENSCELYIQEGSTFWLAKCDIVSLSMKAGDTYIVKKRARVTVSSSSRTGLIFLFMPPGIFHWVAGACEY